MGSASTEAVGVCRVLVLDMDMVKWDSRLLEPERLDCTASPAFMKLDWAKTPNQTLLWLLLGVPSTASGEPKPTLPRDMRRRSTRAASVA
mmetsp:Transcript_59967/g.165978  ORF Transcript_59967/g.165978 Transcript_59967/m.165978 type:complete len:90 (-) Transcript_59967:560-829(-)